MNKAVEGGVNSARRPIGVGGGAGCVVGGVATQGVPGTGRTPYLRHRKGRIERVAFATAVEHQPH